MSDTKLKPPSGNQGSDGFKRNGEGPHEYSDEPFQTAKLGVWLAVGSITMLFGALVMLYMVRQDERANYVFHAPASMIFSTAVLLISSFTYQKGLLAIRRNQQKHFLNLMAATLALGLLFLVSQFVGWTQLALAGLFSPKNPFCVLFYVITAVHALHLLAGLIWLGIVYTYARRGVFTAKKHLAPELLAIYWHFMDGVWVVLFFMLWFF